VREFVDVTVNLEVCQKGAISFMFESISNIVSWPEIHAHYAEIDKRIPPLACYVQEAIGPYYPNTLLEFELTDGADVPDTLGEDGGAARGTNAHGQILPSAIFQQ
jgi:hypothetical protein